MIRALLAPVLVLVALFVPSVAAGATAVAAPLASGAAPVAASAAAPLASSSAATLASSAAPLPRGDALLFVVQADGGTLQPVRGSRGQFELTLRGVPKHALWFSDRPARDTGSVALSRLTGSAWRALGFRADPPNAVVALSSGRRGADTIALELTRPRLGTRSLRFRARILRHLSTGLAHHAPRIDRALPRRFDAASLFIDNGGYGSTAASCDELGQLDLFPSGEQPSAYLPANGQLIAVRGNEALTSLLLFAFGGTPPTTFGIPKVAGPQDGLSYQVCAKAPYPLPVQDGNGDQADTVGTSGANCTVGTVVLKAQQSVPAGWIPADGRTIQTSRSPKLAAALGAAYGGDGTTTFALPALSAPPGLRWDVCADGDAWRAGASATAGDTCTLGRTALFATAGLPSNWSAADGRALPIMGSSANMMLFNLFGTTFGGDGSQTFALPSPLPPAPKTRWGICTSGNYPAM
jgi:microcystin-dependent protein